MTPTPPSTDAAPEVERGMEPKVERQTERELERELRRVTARLASLSAARLTEQATSGRSRAEEAWATAGRLVELAAAMDEREPASLPALPDRALADVLAVTGTDVLLTAAEHEGSAAQVSEAWEVVRRLRQVL